MRRTFNKSNITILIIMMTLALVLSACSDSQSTSNESDSNQEIQKIQVTLWDRGNAPEGSARLTDNYMVKWINEQLEPIGVEVEYIQIPRAEESEKLNVWLASGDAPDLLITYDFGIVSRYAEMGGIRELEDLLDEFGPNIKKNNALALEQAGTYKGVRYAIPAIRSDVGGSSMSIRKDWLDKLGMDIPTNIDELTEVLRAFKEHDPGGVGKDNVIPFGLPSLAGGGQASFYFGVMNGFGINSDAPSIPEIHMAVGNYENSEFTTSIALPEGKEFFKWMNMLYKEGLLPKEFATDLNSQQYKQNFANGYIGFMEENNPAPDKTNELRKTVPEGKYVMVPPFKREDGTQYFNRFNDFGMFIMIPNSSSDKEAEAVVKYLNWMAQPDIIETLNHGVEGYHWEWVDGARKPIDEDRNSQDLWVFGYGDLEIIQQGVTPPQTVDELVASLQNHEDLTTDELRREYAEARIEYRKLITEIGTTQHVFDVPRSVNDKLGPQIGKSLAEGISKLIMADDFNAEYNRVISEWEAIGGRDWDKETTEILNNLNK